MYYVLYDRNLKPIGSSYLLESWSRIRRSYDFDSMSIEGEQIPLSADPFIVVINDKQGKISFSGLASTPESIEKTKKTKITLKDYKTLWNTDILIPNSKLMRRYLFQEIEDFLIVWSMSCDTGLPSVSWDISQIMDIEIEESLTKAQSIFLYDTLSGLLSLYNVYVETELDLYRKTLKFIFKKAGIESVSIRLKDFNIHSVEKSFGDFNRVSIYSKSLSLVQSWGITEDNNIVKISEDTQSLIYPAKVKNFIADSDSAEDINNALYEAVLELSQNRYQENIDIDIQQGKSIIDLGAVDFSYSVNTYIEGERYRTLPVGEIETDSKGKHILRLGYRMQELTQEI